MVRDHVGAESPVKAILIQIGIELREGEGVFGVVGVDDVEPALAELGVNAPAFKHLPVLVDVLRALCRDAAKLAQVHLIGLATATLYLLLHLRRLLLMDGGIALVALHLLQAPCLVHLADAGGAFDFGLLSATFIEALFRLDVGAIYNHMNGIPMGLVLLAILVVQGEDHLLIRIELRRVLLGISHALLWRELTTVDVALIREEGEYLMIHYRVLRLPQLTGLLVSDHSRCLIVTEAPARGLHESRPALDVGASIHVLGVTEKNLLVIVDIGAKVALMSILRDGTLFDDSHGYSSSHLSSSSSTYFQWQPLYFLPDLHAALTPPLFGVERHRCASLAEEKTSPLSTQSTFFALCL